MPQIPALSDLLANYPGAGQAAEAVATLVGGDVEKNFKDSTFAAYKNTCCIRVSRALNYGGDPIPKKGGGLANPYMDNGVIRTDKGGDAKFYIYSVYDLRAYLSGRFGQPKKFKGAITQSDLGKAGVQGIVVFAYKHADIWTGDTCAYHNEEFGNAAVQEVLVYPAP